MIAEKRDQPGWLAGDLALWYVMGLLAAGYILVALFMWRLDFNFMQDDTVLYWQDSFNWNAAFNALYAPLYLWEIAIVRAITFGLIPPILTMMLINLVSLLICGWFIYHIAQACGASTELAALATVLFGFWPLVGLIYTVFPKTDIPALAIYLGGLYLLVKERLYAGTAVLGVAMLAHNVLWPLSPMTLMAYLVVQKQQTGLRAAIGTLVVLGLPLALLLASGAVVKGSLFWTIGGNMRHINSMGYLPVLDGALGTFLRGGFAEIVKGFIIAGIAALAVWTGYQCYRHKPPMYPVGIAISALMVILWLILNSFEIWGMARFSRLLVLPLLWLAADRFKVGLPDTARLRAGITAGLVGLVLSQLVYAWYMVKVFYA